MDNWEFDKKAIAWFILMLRMGATTIWERWNSVLDDGHMSGTEMNSLNHYAYGSVMEYVYRTAWSIEEDGSITMQFEVPFNARATVVLPSYDGKVISLEPGVTKFHYKPTVDYRKKYDWDTRLEEIKEDKKACEILKEDFPLAYEMVQGNNAESLNLSFEELKIMFYMGFNPEMVINGTKRIMEMNIEEE